MPVWFPEVMRYWLALTFTVFNRQHFSSLHRRHTLMKSTNKNVPTGQEFFSNVSCRENYKWQLQTPTNQKLLNKVPSVRGKICYVVLLDKLNEYQDILYITRSTYLTGYLGVDFQMQLAHAWDDGFFALRVKMNSERRILSGETVNTFGEFIHVVLVERKIKVKEWCNLDAWSP